MIKLISKIPKTAGFVLSVGYKYIPKVKTKVNEKVDAIKDFDITVSDISKNLETSNSEIENLRIQLKQIQSVHKFDRVKEICIAILSAAVGVALTVLARKLGWLN